MNKYLVAFAVSIITTFPLVHHAHPLEHTLFDQILSQYVDQEGLIDYNGIGKDQRFSEYVTSLESVKVEDLSRDGQLAFYINAYNAVTIARVVKTKPKKSVRETVIPSVWTSTKFFTTRDHIIAGTQLSLDDIEHEVLRKQFKDPRIHFALVCASRGCPPLPRTAYTGGNVQARLDEEIRRYMSSERGIRIDRAERTVYLSRIFDWFENDFVEASGSVMNFVRPYVKGDVALFLDQKPNVDFVDYNWALNAKEPLR
jgi:hypothetical protein